MVSVQAVIAAWGVDASRDLCALVLPDGCVDVLLERASDGRLCVRTTELMRRPRIVGLRAGTQYRGFRLRPGVAMSRAALRELGVLAKREPEAVASRLDEFARASPRLTEALEALRGAPSVANAARRAGVSARTLQRLVQRQTAWSPDAWRRLGRARGAARAAAQGARLTDVAYGFGFSDQAHLTRELRTWLGVTPGRLRRAGAAARLVHERGYEADPTGEQISTR